MSFILDALRKSEHERQRQSGPGIADLQPTGAQTRFPIWAVALAALLLVNIVVVLVLVLRGESQPATSAASTVVEPRHEERVAAQTALPVQQAPAPIDGGTIPLPQRIEPPDESLVEEAPPYEASGEPRADSRRAGAGRNDPELDAALRTAGEAAGGEEVLPTADDVTLQGTGRIPELHLDIHVYAADPAERFVFINMRKFREGDATREGVRIERITREGVVLNHRGLRFLMPRQ